MYNFLIEQSPCLVRIARLGRGSIARTGFSFKHGGNVFCVQLECLVSLVLIRNVTRQLSPVLLLMMETWIVYPYTLFENIVIVPTSETIGLSEDKVSSQRKPDFTCTKYRYVHRFAM